MCISGGRAVIKSKQLTCAIFLSLHDIVPVVCRFQRRCSGPLCGTSPKVFGYPCRAHRASCGPRGPPPSCFLAPCRIERNAVCSRQLTVRDRFLGVLSNDPLFAGLYQWRTFCPSSDTGWICLPAWQSHQLVESGTALPKERFSRLFDSRHSADKGVRLRRPK